MPTPAPEIVQLLSVFAIAFTAPTWKNAQILLFGAILLGVRLNFANKVRFGRTVSYDKYRRRYRQHRTGG